MAAYRVKWEIDIEAETPQEAAEEAFRSIADGDTLATCYTVEDDAGEKFEVDLRFDEAVAIVMNIKTKKIERYSL